MRVAPVGGAAVRILPTMLEILQPKGGGYAEAKIALPGGRLKGELVDESGAPAAAEVLLRRERSMEGVAEADSDGSFAFIGIDSGTVTLTASTTLQLEPEGRCRSRPALRRSHNGGETS